MGRSLILAMIPFVVACGSSDSAAPPQVDPLVGQYVLTTVGGRALPSLFSPIGTTTRYVTAGAMSIESPSTFSLTYTYIVMDNGVQTSTFTVNVTGNWVRNGSIGLAGRNVQWNGGSFETLVGIISDTGITMTGSVGFTEAGGDFFFTKSP